MTANNLSVIPFYFNLELQDFRRWYAYGNVYPLKVSRKTLVPFFFEVWGLSTTITKVELFRLCQNGESHRVGGDFNNDFSIDFYRHRDKDPNYVTDLFLNNGLSLISSIDKRKFVVFMPTPDTDLNLDEGLFYLKIQVDNEEYPRYSDVFQTCDDSKLLNYTKITWRSENDLLTEDTLIPYSSGFSNTVYLDTDIGMPEYEFEEEGDERMGVFYPIKQVSYKRYQFKFYAPEYLCDVMRLIRLSDSINIVDPLNRMFEPKSFLMNVSWLQQGHYASVQSEFTTNTVVKSIGKGVLI